MDYNNACRLCLSKEGRQLPLFGPRDGLEPLSSRIFSCLSIVVSEFDDLPKQVCHRCECQVNVLHYFRAECELSQRKLKRWHRSLSTSSEVEVDECANERETDLVKVEPEDVELHAEHHFSNCGGLIGFEAPLEGVLAKNSHFTHNNEDTNVRDSYLHVDIQDESNSSCNLVISGTISVAVEDEVSVASVERGFKDGNSSRRNANHNMDEIGCSFQGKVTNNPAVIDIDASRKAVSDAINLESSNDSFSDALTGSYNENTIARSDFTLVDVSQDSTGSKSSPHLEDPLAGSKIEEMQCTDRVFTVKEEPEENEIDTRCQSLHNSILDLQQCYTDSSCGHVSSLPACKNPSSKGTSISMSGNALNQYNVDLPKISNHVLDENSKYCKICRKSFHQNSNLWRHMKASHAKENPFKCMGCSKNFNGRRELVAHMIRTISKDCRAGKEPVQDMSLVFNNKKLRYGTKGKYQCTNCNDKFTKLNYVMAHVRLHTGEKPFFCFKCNREFRLKKTAARHVSLCTGKQAVSKERVNLVSSSIKVSQILKRKAVKPLLKKEKMCKCTVCGKVFKNRIGFSNHLRGGCAKKCLSCSKLVSRKLFSKHYRQCLKTPSVQLVGSEASKQCSNTIQNDQDADKVTTDVKKRVTGRITEIVDATVQELFARHVDSHGNYLLQCQLCQRGMASKHTLYRHLTMHSSSALKCNLCNIRMSLPSVYRTHMLKVHGSPEGNRDNHSENRLFGPGPKISPEKPILETSIVKHKFSGFQASKLKCDSCFKLFSSATSLKFHKQTHKKVRCSKCEITFPASMERLHTCNPKVKANVVAVDHDIIANQEAPNSQLTKSPVQYTCLLCKKKFHTRKMLYQHKKMHIKVKIYQCKICGNSYSDAGALLQHKESAHGSGETPPSGEVDTTQQGIDKDLSLDDGLNTKATERKQWKCGVCHKGFINKKSFKRHLKLHGLTKLHSTELFHNSGTFECHLCDKSFGSYESYCGHKGWHSRQENFSRPFSKSLTADASNSSGNAIFTSSESLKEQNTDIFTCSFCSRRFSSLKSLRIHVTVNHKKPKPVKEIKIDLTSLSDKNDQPILQPESSPPMVADELSSSSQGTALLGTPHGLVSNQVERSSDISKQEPLQCKLCHKEYRSKRSLKDHMMGHSGEKPYKCRSCSNQYSNSKALAKHEKERHPIILRPFSCNKCKTSFVKKEELLAHHELCTH